MSMKHIKIAASAAVIFLAAVVAVMSGTDHPAAAAATVDDAAATYKAKCAMCHGPAAAKAFDTAKTDEYHIEVILKGKKGDKPPYMPGYEDKGINAEAAKALVAHMRQLRAAAQ